MKTGVYVGSFNPVHKGHIKVINYLLENKIVDKVIVVPTGSYWDKNNLIDIKHRINMLKYYENKNIIINDKLNDLQYTYQVLRELNSKYNNIYLIIGNDNLPKLNLWKNIDEILINKVIVMNRVSLDNSSYINNFKQKDNFILVKDFKQINISSTMIRAYVKENNNLKEFLDNDVIEYILTNGLYRC